MITVFSNESFQALLGINVLYALGLYLMMSTGQLSLGQAGFAAVGAYASSTANVTLGWPAWFSILFAILCAAIVAAPVAIGASRVRGVYLIIGTLAVGSVMATVIRNVEWLDDGNTVFGQDRLEPVHILAACLVVLAIVLSIERSRAGLMMRATRGDDDAARSLGVPTRMVRIAAVIAGAAFTGLGGALYAHTIGYIQPSDFGFALSFEIALFVLIGGTDHWLGPLVGAFLVSYLPEAFRSFERYRELVIGLSLLATMIFSPRGILTRARIASILRAFRPGTSTPEEEADESVAGSKPDSEVREPPTGPPGSWPVVLSVSGLTKRFSGLTALDGVDLDVRGGEILGVIGPNGAGKTTLINVATGLLPASAGKVELHGTDVTSLPAHRRARSGMARTFQAVRLFSDLTVQENLEVAQRASLPGQTALDRLGIRRFAAHLPSALPYGEQRKVQIVQALASEPSVLFLDEPSIGLDPEELDELGRAIVAIRDEGTGVVLVDHNLDLVMERADRIVVLDFGRKIAEGSPEEVLQDERVQVAYLGTHTGGGASA
ncbi:branched-chain amino acid ABC transporter ATP-binding protein/permease [soil metagenome]